MGWSDHIKSDIEATKLIMKSINNNLFIDFRLFIFIYQECRSLAIIGQVQLTSKQLNYFFEIQTRINCGVKHISNNANT